ncbi:hypothetical protein BD626DRAFT_159416 [Schizophyllum amplum]|uniref:Uncharacterized protein n=1 Tax=Schizophyllum amplum TaxID=97359 RepID=A0A550CNV4_9AGAR|nr:hypothetical protein BD626DRAFT_159416 [Auriculariopsis ampla]
MTVVGRRKSLLVENRTWGDCTCRAAHRLASTRGGRKAQATVSRERRGVRPPPARNTSSRRFHARQCSTGIILDEQSEVSFQRDEWLHHTDIAKKEKAE